MTVAATLGELADMLEGPYYENRSDHFAAHSWIHGALSIIADRAVHEPAAAAVATCDPQWREWDREQAITRLRELAGQPEVQDTELKAAREELETTRQALGAALGIHPASHYSLAQMIVEVADRVPAKQEPTTEPAAPAPAPTRPRARSMRDVHLPETA